MKVVLTVVEGPQAGLSFEFDRHDTFIVGRSSKAQFRLSEDDTYFSRNHFLIEVSPPLLRILDLTSTNGTYVNDRRVDWLDLKTGDEIRGGNTTLRVTIEGCPDNPDPGTAGEFTIPPTAAAAIPRPMPAQRRSDNDTLVPGGVRRRPMPRTPAVPDAANAPAAAAPEHAAVAFPRLAGYEILRFIGQGGMGRLFEAMHEASGCRVALKVIKPAVDAGDEELSRFIREAQILRSLNHPHIVRCQELRHTGGQLCIVMEFVDGPQLGHVLKETAEPMPVTSAVQLTLQLLDALAYAHDRGVVHRDVKPENLLIASTRSNSPHLFLADFGLARAYHASRLSGLTVTGEVGGTTPYMPPEQITNYRNVGPAADQYAAAASLYYMLTKQHVYDFPREPPRQLLMILQNSPVPITDRRSGLPSGLVAAIHKSLSRDSDQRFESVRDFASALSPFA